jgi:hypothetical protein
LSEIYKVASDMAPHLQKFATLMRNIFFLSLAISLLVLLLPRKLDADGIQKDILVAVSILKSGNSPLTDPLDLAACHSMGK